MVRRVGFGGDGEPPRNKAQRENRDAPPPRGGKKRFVRLLVGAFLCVWLIGWSLAIAAAVEEIMAEGLGAAETALFVWVAVAAVFWVIALVFLWRLMTGRPISNRQRRNWGGAKPSQGGLRNTDFDDRGGDD